MFDDQATGAHSLRDAKREELYGDWLRAAQYSDFIGVQNYERAVWDDKGKLPAPQGATLNYMGSEVYAPSLANAVRYAHEVTGKPILVTEHGVGTDDDRIRADFIPAALTELKKIMDAGVPVAGYVHWALLDNFEWIGGFTPHFGLHTVDLQTLKRQPKPSALVYRDIAKSNSV
ncbi:family 1 glycosylhydrolase [Pokkaliibacter sp. MBI-7]|uniref:family 1 glycosylhydrolase n=1 Tax=Pokkaliibacter sp. MBI-7 TaxID=3040600 RepID=UPI0024469D70|nr:family 1 glycosylhydrolase [Pokkaliibacter sp. MBI-7]MDH2435384.1 family 1 glycosylhydrolase [Pokkaliibacter sp. MBI-7]